MKCGGKVLALFVFIVMISVENIQIVEAEYVTRMNYTKLIDAFVSLLQWKAHYFPLSAPQLSELSLPTRYLR